MADGPPLVFEQIDIGQAERITVELVGSTLPDRGVSAGTRQRHNTEFLPGASEPIVQIMGVEYEPMTFGGTFNDSDAGAGSATYLSSQLKLMAQAGIPVVLTWGVTWERRGLVESYTETPDMEDLINWSLVFRPWTMDDPSVGRTVEVGDIEFDSAELGVTSTDLNANAGAVRSAQDRAPASLLGRIQ